MQEVTILRPSLDPGDWSMANKVFISFSVLVPDNFHLGLAACQWSLSPVAASRLLVLDCARLGVLWQAFPW